jgi:hypothetical protein
MFLLVRSVGGVFRERGDQDFACSSPRMIIECFVSAGEAQSTTQISLQSMLGMVVLSNARGPLVGIELNAACSQASACETYHSIDIKPWLVGRSGRLFLDIAVSRTVDHRLSSLSLLSNPNSQPPHLPMAARPQNAHHGASRRSVLLSRRSRSATSITTLVFSMRGGVSADLVDA